MLNCGRRTACISSLKVNEAFLLIVLYAEYSCRVLFLQLVARQSRDNLIRHRRHLFLKDVHASLYLLHLFRYLRRFPRLTHMVTHVEWLRHPVFGVLAYKSVQFRNSLDIVAIDILLLSVNYIYSRGHLLSRKTSNRLTVLVLTIVSIHYGFLYSLLFRLLLCLLRLVLDDLHWVVPGHRLQRRYLRVCFLLSRLFCCWCKRSRCLHRWCTEHIRFELLEPRRCVTLSDEGFPYLR